ncbi:DNA recombination protein RmuC [Hippea jasoniae]|uniref:DNA recombination protein RmuC n=1 Tax=Hippea jasoniae TaxID=944479 RepID=UPI00054D8399|nr:DNA recombination protein RmuC [Hippea jasoniae]
MVEYLVVALIVVNIVVLAVLFSQKRENRALEEKLETLVSDLKNSNQEAFEKNTEALINFSDRVSTLSSTLKDEFYTKFKDLNEMLDKVSTELSTAIEKQLMQSQKEAKDFMELVNNKLLQISDRVDERLRVSFENIDKTFKDIVEGIVKISEAQKKIEELSGEVVSLQKILDDKKKRGVFGEVRLENILASVFGESRELYDIQYSLTNDSKKVIADAVLKIPNVGIVAIDSKFPLENYVKMIEAEGVEKKQFEEQFKRDVKKHISDIAGKYIIGGVTADMAVMFLPAEAIFAHINAYHADIVEFARRNKVWIASPTTLLALLTTIQAVSRDIKTLKQAEQIQIELRKLADNFNRFKTRWEKLFKDVEKLHKDATEFSISTQKITAAFEKIEKVDFSQKESLEDKNE